MNDYDDSEDYSSANSFRARSNTWPLNRPELALPNSVCIDETLPEIELEEDDLFTTNENWSTSNMVDHDIMSWDPILNAQPHLLHLQPHLQQHQQPPPPTGSPLEATTQPQTLNNNNNGAQQQHQQHQHQHQLQSQQLPAAANQQAISPQPGDGLQQHPTNNIQAAPPSNLLEALDQNEYHLQQLHHLRIDNSHTQHHYNLSPTLSTSSSSTANNNSSSNNNNNNMGSAQSASTLTLGAYNSLPSSDHHHQHHHQQLHDQHHHNHHQHQQQQQHQQQRHLQSLSSANYNDLDQHLHQQQHTHHQHHQQQQHHNHNHHHHDLNLNSTHDAAQAGHLNEHHHLHHHHHDPHLIHIQQHQHQHHQLHHLTSEALDQNPLIMASAGTSDAGLLGLGGDLEDLDYNKVVNPSTILRNPTQHYEEPQQDQEDPSQQSQQQQQQQLQHQPPQPSNPQNANNLEQSSSTASSKTKLNTPRRNAWGNMSYADLISQAINSTTDKRLTLSQIYDWMVQHVPYFKDKGDSNSSAGWKNSVRHNLSLHNRFKRLQNEGTGKSSWWTINPETNVGKCARRRAASMEASKYEKKRGRAKKRAEAIRQGLVSYPSLTNSLLNGSSGNLDASDLQKIQASTSTITSQTAQPKQEAENPNSTNAPSQAIDSGVYNSQYEQKDIELHQMQQQEQKPQPQQMSHSPPKETLPLKDNQQDVNPSSQQQQLQQPQQHQQPPPQQPPPQQPSDQVQQIHQIVHKTEQADFDSYYIQHNHQDLHQLQNHQGHLDSRDQIDLFNRHAIYLSEPCNDCNCTELINCGTNAMSYT